MLVTMTNDKVGKTLHLVHKALCHKTHIIRFIAKIIGKINAIQPANQYTVLFTKNMEIDKIQVWEIRDLITKPRWHFHIAKKIT